MYTKHALNFSFSNSKKSRKQVDSVNYIIIHNITCNFLTTFAQVTRSLKCIYQRTSFE